MLANDLHMLDKDLLNSKSIDISASHAILLANMEQLFSEARPRLLRLTRLNGIAPDCGEDIVQETLLEAWRHLANLREPLRFNSWLDGICRNVCRRQKVTRDTTLSLHNLLSNSSLKSDEPFGMDASIDIIDPLSPDPLEELSQRDLATLLDRAMGHLSPDTRKLLAMCYLAELPQREAAVHLGLTIGALELRLHRARLQLRRVLNGELRSEAQDFGLLLDPQDALDWQQTRQWCWFCGKRRMLSRFETRADGNLDLCTRCPECSRRYDIVMIHSIGMTSLDDLRTFRPALKRLMQDISKRASWTVTSSKCLYCYNLAALRVFHSQDSAISLPPDRYWISIDCPRCGNNISGIDTIMAANPAAQRFLIQHERFITESHHITEYNGAQVICLRITDITSANQMTMLIDVQTLQCLATFSN